MKIKKILLLSTIGLMSMFVGSASTRSEAFKSSDNFILNERKEIERPNGFKGIKENLLTSYPWEVRYDDRTESRICLYEDKSKSFLEAVNSDRYFTIAVKVRNFTPEMGFTFGAAFEVNDSEDSDATYDSEPFAKNGDWYYCYLTLWQNYYIDQIVVTYGNEDSDPHYNSAINCDKIDKIMVYEGFEVPQDSFYYIPGTKENLLAQPGWVNKGYYSEKTIWRADTKSLIVSGDSKRYFTIACKIKNFDPYANDWSFGAGLDFMQLDEQDSYYSDCIFQKSGDWYYGFLEMDPFTYVTSVHINCGNESGIGYDCGDEIKMRHIDAVMLYEGHEIPQDSFYSIIEDKEGPLISGSNTTYVTDVDNPITVDDIKSKLIAYDLVDGDVSSTITVTSDNYSGNEHKLGSYDVEFSAHDNSNNQSTLRVNIEVKDSKGPSIVGPDILRYSYTQKKELSEILANFTATDNYDESVELTVNSDTYSTNYSHPGMYKIILKSQDSSSNVTTKEVAIEVYDDVAPVITGSSTLTKSTSVVLTAQDILKQYTANDEIDGPCKLTIEEDNYSGNASKVGEYTLTLSATDKTGNKGTFKVTIMVKDDIAPVWYTPKTIIHVQDTIQLSKKDVINVLINQDELPKNYSSITLTSNYVFDGEEKVEINSSVSSESVQDEIINLPGVYNMKINARYQDGREINLERQIEVYTSEDAVAENESFWDGFCNFWVNVWNNFCNFWINIWNSVVNLLGHDEWHVEGK